MIYDSIQKTDLPALSFDNGSKWDTPGIMWDERAYTQIVKVANPTYSSAIIFLWSNEYFPWIITNFPWEKISNPLPVYSNIIKPS